MNESRDLAPCDNFALSRRQRVLIGSGIALLALGAAVNAPYLMRSALSPQTDLTATAAAERHDPFAELPGADEEAEPSEELPLLGHQSGKDFSFSSNSHAEQAARQAGILGMMSSASDDADVWGGLTGTEVGEAFGVGGLGLVGTGRGGGGTGEGILGLMKQSSGHFLASPHGYAYARGHARGHARVRHGSTYERPPEPVSEADFISTADDPLSTFSIDVDTAGYSSVRRTLHRSGLPSPDQVRVEEMINYFEYDYTAPVGPVPFSVNAEVGECPWNPEHRIVHIGLQGKTIAAQDIPPRNLVFLVDVSGSMGAPDKLPLVQRSLEYLTGTLRPQDRVSLVTYAGSTELVLPPTRGNQRDKIRSAIERLNSSGGTNGAAGIELAYAQAREAFIRGGINRVIMATDGDFNVGVSSHNELVDVIENKRKHGVYLSILGYGMRHSDHTMEQLADKGNGNYAYIDSDAEAHKVLVEQAGATLVTIAKDVKIQVELNDEAVESYRLIGYDNRRLAHEDFDDDRKDAGEIGAGHTVTALYEVVPRSEHRNAGPWMDVNLRYKAPHGERSRLVRMSVGGKSRPLDKTSDNFRFSAAVASFGMQLQCSDHTGDATLEDTQRLAEGALGPDPKGRRLQFVQMVKQAASAARSSWNSSLCGEAPKPPPVIETPPPPPVVETPKPKPEPKPPVVIDTPEPTPTVVVVHQPQSDWTELLLGVLRLLPPLMAFPLFVLAYRRPRRRD